MYYRVNISFMHANLLSVRFLEFPILSLYDVVLDVTRYHVAANHET